MSYRSGTSKATDLSVEVDPLSNKQKTSNQLKNNLSKKEFQRFAQQRKVSLLKQRNRWELAVDFALEDVFKILGNRYRLFKLPQKQRFMPVLGLVYADNFVRAISLRSNQGKKFWIEIDEEHHFTPQKMARDAFRQKIIMDKYKGQLKFIRFRIEEIESGAFVERLKNEIDWDRP